MKKLLLASSLACSFALVGCAHHRDVRPGPNGIHRVIVKSEGGEEGTRDAIAQANHYCAQTKKEAVFLEENQAYKGSMAEKDYNTAKTVSKAATAAGSALWVFGGKNESAAGGLVGLGGGVANGALGKQYSVDMKFKCQ